MKSSRQKKVLELIEQKEIGTQEELVALLNECYPGYCFQGHQRTGTDKGSFRIGKPEVHRYE